MDFVVFRWIGRVVLCMIPVIAVSLPVGAAPPGLNPCALVTTAEVEQVIGKLRGTSKGETLADAKSCTYEFANGQDEFEIWISPGDAFARMRKDAKNPVTVGGFGRRPLWIGETRARLAGTHDEERGGVGATFDQGRRRRRSETKGLGAEGCGENVTAWRVMW